MTDNVLVSDADYEAVLGRVVLVLCLGDESLASIVVRLALYCPAGVLA